MADGLFKPYRMYETLKEQGLLPELVFEELKGRAGEYRPSENTIALSKENKKTMAHEMTHAVQTNLLESTAAYLGNKKDLSEKEAQFLKAYNQLTGNKIGGRSELTTPSEKDILKRYQDYIQSFIFDRFDEDTKSVLNSPLSKDKDIRASQEAYKRWHEYRTTPDELQAWGVGYTSTPEQDDSVPSHVNPSMTTEFDILLSMYEGLPDVIKKEAVTKRKGDIENFKFSSLTEEPFANPLLKKGY